MGQRHQRSGTSAAIGDGEWYAAVVVAVHLSRAGRTYDAQYEDDGSIEGFLPESLVRRRQKSFAAGRRLSSEADSA